MFWAGAFLSLASLITTALPLSCRPGARDRPIAEPREGRSGSSAVLAAEPFPLPLPLGFPEPEIPAENPLTPAKIELGRRLFYDPRLSGPGNVSCSSCHRQELAFTDGLPRAVGATGSLHPRSAQSLVNVVYRPRLGWAEPELESLEEQLLTPLFNRQPIEMGLGGRKEEVLARLAADPTYRTLLGRAFPDDPRPLRLEQIRRALASFERSLISGNSPYDRLLFRDERSALSAQAKRGMQLFFSDALACSECHSGLDFAGPMRQTARSSLAEQVVGFRPPPRPESAAGDEQSPRERLLKALFFNTALYDVDGLGTYPIPNQGLFATTRTKSDMGRFRVPTLRNVAVSAPYMHDGSLATLADVIDHYALGGRAADNPLKSTLMGGFELAPGDREALVAFLESLTDRGFLSDPRFADPFAAEAAEATAQADARDP